MQEYIIWNPSKTDDAVSYTQLLEHTEREGGANYSFIKTDNIFSFVNAVYAETDVQLKYVSLDSFEYKYYHLLDLIKDCQYFLNTTDNSEPVALLKYLESLEKKNEV